MNIATCPLAQLQESPTNPRRRFDEHSLNELAASFKSQGVLQPLLVRAIDTDMYEVVAGARSYRAAKLAELVMFLCALSRCRTPPAGARN